MLAACRGTTISSSPIRFEAAHGGRWLAAVAVLLVLSSRPCTGLEIDRVTVNSHQGEPLDAVVRILLGPDENIDDGCLSVADRQQFVNPEHALISQARLALLGSRGPIRVTTETPVTEQVVSVGLRVQCDAGSVSVRPVNFYLKPPPSTASIAVDPSLPGTTITVRAGDSVYKLSRLIYPHNEAAVRNLARSIILANPALFPDGRGRPLQIGERLTIPDLRTVKQIVAQSQSAAFQARLPAETAVTETPRTTISKQAADAIKKQSPAAAADIQKRNKIASHTPPGAKRKLIATGKLRLQLATSLDLSRAQRTTRAKRMTPPRPPDAAVATGADQSMLLEISDMLRRADRIHQGQESINARLARIETAAVGLKQAMVQTRTQRPPSAPPPKQPAVRSTEPARLPVVAPPATEPAAVPWWRSYSGAALLMLLALVALLLARKLFKRRALANQRTRIDAMLEQARTMATPLLGSEPGPAAADAGTIDRSVAPLAKPPAPPEAAKPRSGEHIEEETFDPTKTMPFAYPAAAETKNAAASEQPSTRLRAEMDDAMDSTRSMFTDVDRFITLGRIQNAISLLEFQIKRDPADRGSWIKLMAVYRHQGMDDDFERTYAAFRDHFGDGLGV